MKTKKALVLVDLAKDFFPGGALGVEGADLLIGTWNKMIEYAQKSGWLIIFTRDWHPKDTSHFIKWKEHCVQNTHGAEFHKDLIFPSTAYILSKGMGNEDAYSAFDEHGTVEGQGMNLEDFLKSQGIKTVYIGGLATDYCVKATVLDSIKNGFETFFLVDAMAAVNVKMNDERDAIHLMKMSGAIQTTTVDVCEQPIKRNHLEKPIKRLPPLNLDLLDQSMLEEPIVTSVLEDDFYKFSMGNFLFDHPHLANAEMEWRFKNRTKDVHLAQFITEDDFMAEYAHVIALQATRTELHYLRGVNEYETRMFDEPYLDHLANLRIPEPTFGIENGQLDIRTKGPWIHSKHAEIPTLRIVNGLYYRAQLKKMSRMEREAVYAEGIQRLSKNIKIIKDNPKIFFSDFGNRRSFGTMWHDFVISRCAEELGSQFVGTSKVSLASKYDLMPIGTCAHELSMGMVAMEFDGSIESIKKPFIKLHESWWKKYSYALSISLPDTYGTDFAFKFLPKEVFHNWKGFRIDSKDPMEAIPSLFEKYKSFNIDPKGKMSVPSDGLDIPDMINITNKFADQTKISFGWGTKLTNNLGLKQLSIVSKPYSIDGKYCVKISDNAAKAMGHPETVEAYKKALQYHETYSKKCEV